MARIHRQVTVVRDGMHNAFTDLAYWQGAYWVSYRKGTAHASIDGQMCLSVSVDRTRFRESAHLKAPGDNRDPKLVVIDDDHLALISPTWLGGYDKLDLQQYISFSNDGFTWERLQPILERGRWLWRVRRHDDLFYGLVQVIGSDPRIHLELMTSRDLLHWDPLCVVGDGSQPLNESDIFWHPNGEAWIVARGLPQPERGDPGYSWFACARAPYSKWELSKLDTVIHAPVMLEHAGCLYVTGRSHPDVDGETTFPYLSRVSLGLWRVDRGQTTKILSIPATGDCSYPGLIKDPDGRICLSYYSQHAYHSGVIGMPFRLEPVEPHDQGQLLTPDDVYFAELELP
ncbi:hypothetical protein HQ590_06825 [bacterium]|nr:hypothetical protein [bacterium]